MVDALPFYGKNWEGGKTAVDTRRSFGGWAAVVGP